MCSETLLTGVLLFTLMTFKFFFQDCGGTRDPCEADPATAAGKQAFCEEGKV